MVPRLQSAGHLVRVLTRRGPPGTGTTELVPGDLETGVGIDAALEGVETVVHLAGSAKGDDAKARILVSAAQRAGVSHLVYISVVGAERVPVRSAVDRAAFAYFGFKRAAEIVVEDSGLPWTTLRATQFHELTLSTAQLMAKLPVIAVPHGVRFQPIAAVEVAERLVELTGGEPAGLVPDLAGPRAYPMADLLRSYLRAAHRRRLILPVPPAGGAARAIRGGANLALDRAVGRHTWEEFLAEEVTGGGPAAGTDPSRAGSGAA